MPTSPLAALVGEPNLFIIPFAVAILAGWSVHLMRDRQPVFVILLAMCVPYAVAWYDILTVVSAHDIPSGWLIGGTVVALTVVLVLSLVVAGRMLWRTGHISFSVGALALNAVAAFGVATEHLTGIAYGSTIDTLANISYSLTMWVLPFGVLAYAICVVVSTFRQPSPLQG